jgi:hypothetical protein
VRDDYPGDPETRTSSCGHRPFYGDGVVDNPDIAIFGHEPGNDFDHEPDSDPDQFGPNYTEYAFDEARSQDISSVSVGSNSIESLATFFDLLTENFDLYWSQVKKCNELEDDDRNDSAAERCGRYLKDEIRATDPDYVISLGKKAYLKFDDVFDIEDIDQNFARAIGSGERSSGFLPLSVAGESFTYVPIGHPSYGVHSQTAEQIKISGADNETSYYYELVAEDLIKYINESQ